MSNDAESYSLSISVPHVVNPDHHILGCQIVGYTPGAVNPHAWLDFHYYTNEYILSADRVDARLSDRKSRHRRRNDPSDGVLNLQ